MSVQPLKQRRKIGRPPAGARDGEKVKDYPQLSVRVPAEVKAKLRAISIVATRPQWRLITDAIDCYLRGRPEEEQRQVDDLLKRSVTDLIRPPRVQAPPRAHARRAGK